MTIYHTHHIVPRHMGGTDDPDNLKRGLTIEEHAEEHRLLWKKHGKQEDYIAWKCLSGQITNYEANILATKAANTGRKLSKEQNDALQASARRSNQERLINGTHNWLGGKRISKIQKDLINMGKHNFTDSAWQSEHAKKKVNRQIENGRHCSQIKKECPHCNKIVDIANYNRWHGDRCKKRGPVGPLE